MTTFADRRVVKKIKITDVYVVVGIENPIQCKLLTVSSSVVTTADLPHPSHSVLNVFCPPHFPNHGL